MSFPRMTLCLLTLLSVWARPVSATEFEAVTIDPQPGKVGYAVTAADINGDGRLDAVVVTEDRVLWYEAPDWNLHEMIVGGTRKDHVCIATRDIDGDGLVDFVLGAGWPRNGGMISWLSRDPQRGASGLWNRYPIDAEPWTHRMRFGDVLGTGTPQLVVSALNGNEQHGARLLAFEIPADPRVDRWRKTVLTDDVQRMHNHWCLPASEVLPGRKLQREVTLTASQEGVSVVAPGAFAGDPWQRELLMTDAGPVAAGGAGEVKFGKLADGTSLLATIEPMHGNAAVVYLFDGPLGSTQGRREVLVDTLAQGHAVWCADFDADVSDEVVIGHRQQGTGETVGPGVYLFDRRDGGWEQQVIDEGGMACEDLTVADFNGDGRLDILAAGRATHNVKIYFQKPSE